MIKQTIKRIFSIFYPATYKSGLLVLNYHSVQPGHDFSLAPEEFEKQMAYLKSNFRVVTNDGVEGSGVRVLITFDDGYENNYTYAFPILQKYDLPTTIFLLTDFVFNGQMINDNWAEYKGLKPLKKEQITEMSAKNITFGSHSKTHPRFSDLSTDQFIDEIVSSKKIIEQNIGKNVDTFAFPFGQKRDYGHYDGKIFEQSGYKMVLTTDWGINVGNFDPMHVKRIRIDHFDTINDFKNKLSGKWDFVSFFQKLKV
jgi:peptidoglycan/xylan/chitin deacetylase (PgdA/CDA1 family)